jgi:hypothetical protein
MYNVLLYKIRMNLDSVTQYEMDYEKIREFVNKIYVDLKNKYILGEYRQFYEDIHNKAVDVKIANANSLSLIDKNSINEYYLFTSNPYGKPKILQVIQKLTYDKLDKPSVLAELNNKKQTLNQLKNIVMNPSIIKKFYRSIHRIIKKNESYGSNDQDWTTQTIDDVINKINDIEDYYRSDPISIEDESEDMIKFNNNYKEWKEKRKITIIGGRKSRRKSKLNKRRKTNRRRR